MRKLLAIATIEKSRNHSMMSKALLLFLTLENIFFNIGFKKFKPCLIGITTRIHAERSNAKLQRSQEHTTNSDLLGTMLQAESGAIAVVEEVQGGLCEVFAMLFRNINWGK